MMECSFKNAERQWMKLVGQHLGQRFNKKWEKLILDVLCVDLGLKPAVLFDFTPPDVLSVCTFLKALQDQEWIQSRTLKILCLGMDVLIVNRDIYSTRAIADICEDVFCRHFVVDVSANLDQPKIIPGDSRCLEHTRTCFTGLLEDLQSDKNIISLSLDADSTSLPNPTTLFGIFLGYPVVYWYDMTLDSQENCLSMVPLINYRVESSVLDGNGRVSISSGRYKTHVVCSFSVPEVLGEQTSQKVDLWFDWLRNLELWQSSSIQLSELKLDREIVQVPSVCL